MALLSKSGIDTGNTIQSSHVTNIYDALNGSGSYEVIATGSFSGSFNGLITSSSYAVSASYAANLASTSIQTTGSTLYSTNPKAGYSANQSDIGHENNILFGTGSGGSIGTTSNLIAIGARAGFDASGSNNSVFIGEFAGSDGVSPYTVAIGDSAGGSGDLAYTVAIGRNALINVSGEKIVAAGYQAGANATTNYSVLLGNEAGSGLVGNNNIIIGNNVSLPTGTANAINIGGVLFGSNTWNNAGFAQLTGSRSTGRIGIAKVNPSATLDVSGSVLVTGSLNVSSGITGSLFGTSSFAVTASYISSNSITQNIIITGSLNVSGSATQTSSSIVVTLPSGSSTQKYGVAIFKFKQFPYLTSQTKIYEDDYIRLSYDSSGFDPELTVKVNPTAGRIQCVTFSTKFPGSTEAIDGIVSLSTVDIWPSFGIGSDEVLTTYITAGLDHAYPYYIVNWYRTNTTYGGNISCVVHRYGTDI